jgi:antagonist of KipI
VSIRVLAPGWLTSVQDAGRCGHASLGIGMAGAMDPAALRLANALVGNTAAAAGLEMTLRGPRLRFDGGALIALTGADIEARCGMQPIPAWRPVWIGGGEIEFGAVRRGARAYLAVAGGIDVAPVLGSRSTDVNSALGPFGGRGVVAGDDLPVGAAAADRRERIVSAIRRSPDPDCSGGHDVATVRWSLDPRSWLDTDSGHPLALLRGAQFDRLDSASRSALFAGEFRVGNESNRVGCRLEKNRLQLTAPFELVSEGVVPGTLQLPPNGDPIALMAEAPTTGGYPRIGHVAAVDLPRLAQCRPGDHVRFIDTTLAQAQSRLLARDRAIAALVQNIHDRLSA